MHIERTNTNITHHTNRYKCRLNQQTKLKDLKGYGIEIYVFISRVLELANNRGLNCEALHFTFQH